jgi:amino acid transporter
MNATVSRRQPLTGTAISALCGILLAEFFELPTPLLWPSIALAAIVSLTRPMTWLTHLLVAAAFFALHLVQLKMRLARN